MTAIIWPSYISPNSIDWWLDTPTKSGGQSILGNGRIVATPAARWRATMTVRIWGTQGDPNQMLFWRSFAAWMGGRAGSVTIGPFDLLTPEILKAVAPENIALSFSDGALFSDGSAFPGDTSVAGTVWLTASAQAGAATASVVNFGLGALQAGQYFGLGGTELHIITAATKSTNGSYSLSFAPPLRAAWSAGAELDFTAPRATMRLSADDTARQKITIGGVADVTLDLVEVF